MKKSATTAEEFVRAWMQSKTVAEVAERVGSNERAVSVRASLLRRRGVNLPKLYQSCGLDVEALKKLVKEMS